VSCALDPSSLGSFLESSESIQLRQTVPKSVAEAYEIDNENGDD
jgi:hypothetical protein